MREFERVRAAIIRGGTSKAVFLMDNELPSDQNVRDQVILAVYGSPDSRQINGLGGADPLTSKLAIIKPSERDDADVDYTFGQVSINKAHIDYAGNCGNISSAVGPFAIDEGLVPSKEPITIVRIYNTNTKKVIEAEVPVMGGKAMVEGDCAIAGVPGTGAKIFLNFLESGGSITGKLLPTGNKKDLITLSDGSKLYVSIVDAANPIVVARAEDIGLTAKEVPDDVNNDSVISTKLEEIRSIAAEMLGFVVAGEVAADKSPAVPKMVYVAKADDYVTLQGEKVAGSDISLLARTMSMQKMHKAYAVTGGIATSTCALLEGTVANDIIKEHAVNTGIVLLGHPSGIMEFKIDMTSKEDQPHLRKAGVARTARRLMDGYAYVPSRIFWS